VANSKHAISFTADESRNLKTLEVPQGDTQLAAALAGIVGADPVLGDFETRLQYGRDCLPHAKYLYRSGKQPGTFPSLVVRPADGAQMVQVMKFLRDRKARLIPVGTCSGVLGGSIPLCDEVAVDTARMDHILKIDSENHLVTVQGGMNGGDFEAELNAAG